MKKIIGIIVLIGLVFFIRFSKQESNNSEQIVESSSISSEVSNEEGDELQAQNQKKYDQELYKLGLDQENDVDKTDVDSSQIEPLIKAILSEMYNKNIDYNDCKKDENIVETYYYIANAYCKNDSEIEKLENDKDNFDFKMNREILDRYFSDGFNNDYGLDYGRYIDIEKDENGFKTIFKHSVKNAHTYEAEETFILKLLDSSNDDVVFEYFVNECEFKFKTIDESLLPEIVILESYEKECGAGYCESIVDIKDDNANTVKKYMVVWQKSGDYNNIVDIRPIY